MTKTHYPKSFKANYLDDPARGGVLELGQFWYSENNIIVVLPMKIECELRRIVLPLDKWNWNKNILNPSLSPSIKVCRDPEQTEIEWHGYLTAGVFTECG